MVTAGTKNRKINGIKLKTLLSDESFARNISLENIHPVIKRNTDITIYAMGE